MAAEAQLADVYRTLGEVQADVRNLREDVAKMAAAIEKRDDVMIAERAANRRALWALTGSLLVALIAASATIIAAGVLG